MRHRRGVPGLRPEPLERLGMLSVVVPEQLDRYRPAKHQIDATPDLAHAARGDPVVEPVPVGEHVGSLGQGHSTPPYRGIGQLTGAVEVLRGRSRGLRLLTGRNGPPSRTSARATAGPDPAAASSAGLKPGKQFVQALVALVHASLIPEAIMP